MTSTSDAWRLRDKNSIDKNSNGTTVRTFSEFNLLRGRCTLLLFPASYVIMRSWSKCLEGIAVVCDRGWQEVGVVSLSVAIVHFRA